MKRALPGGGSRVSEEGGERVGDGKRTSGQGRGKRGFVRGSTAREAWGWRGSGGVTYLTP